MYICCKIATQDIGRWQPCMPLFECMKTLVESGLKIVIRAIKVFGLCVVVVVAILAWLLKIWNLCTIQSCNPPFTWSVITPPPSYLHCCDYIYCYSFDYYLTQRLGKNWMQISMCMKCVWKLSFYHFLTLFCTLDHNFLLMIDIGTEAFSYYNIVIKKCQKNF